MAEALRLPTAPSFLITVLHYSNKIAFIGEFLIDKQRDDVVYVDSLSYVVSHIEDDIKTVEKEDEGVIVERIQRDIYLKRSS